MPLREQCVSYSGPNVITLYKLGVTEAGGTHRLMTFYCYCSATIKLFTTPASAAEGFYLSEREREKTQNQQIEHITSVIQRKIINLSIKCYFDVIFCAVHFHTAKLLSSTKIWCTLHRMEKNLICALALLYKCVLFLKHGGQRWVL